MRQDQDVDRTKTEGQREDLFHLLVTSVRDYAIFLLDPHGQILTWNEGAQRIKGYTADEIVGKHFSTFYLPEDLRGGKPQYALLAAADEGRWEEESWRVRKDGSRFWASVVITALYDAAGTLVGYAKVTRDLTERKHADEERMQLLARERVARAEAEASLGQVRALQSVTEVALTHLSLDDLLNALLERISDLLAVDTAAVLLVADDEPGTLVARAARGIEEGVEQGMRIPIDHGFAGRILSELRPIGLDDVAHTDTLDPLLRAKGIRSLLGVPLLLEGRVLGVLLVGMLQPRRFSADDIQLSQVIADRVALLIERALLIDAATAARAETEAAAAQIRAQDEFLAVAAHELKTPLTSVKTATELLLRRYARQGTPDPQQVQRSLHTIDRQIDKLARLVTLLLETVRMQAGRLRIERTLTNLTQMVQQVVAQAQARTEQHQLVIAAGEDVWAAVDPLRLEQVVQNLLENAIKFSPEGGRIDITVQRSTSETVQLLVRDRGLGVLPELRPHLFERFFQAHGSSYQSGLGLGLYISHSIVAQHGGTISAEFPPDGGTRMVVTLPAALDAPGADGERDSR